MSANMVWYAVTESLSLSASRYAFLNFIFGVNNIDDRERYVDDAVNILLCSRVWCRTPRAWLGQTVCFINAICPGLGNALPVFHAVCS